MSTIRQCDRCKRQINKGETCHLLSMAYPSKTAYIDLCQDCFDKFMIFVNGDIKPKEEGSNVLERIE